ncbi:MAG: hypothetical protein ACTHLC_09430 [Rhizobiaceae bacterium]
MTKVAMGPLTIAIVGEGPVYGAVRDEIAEALEPSLSPADIEFRFSRASWPAPCRSVGSVMISGAGTRFSRAGLLYAIEQRKDGTTLVEIASDAISRPASQAVRRILDWNYLSHPELQAKIFLYDIFDWITELHLLERQASYIHAGTLARDGRAIAIMGWGGAGKTTSLLKLCLEDGWAYLSDDLGLVDVSGQLYRTPKRIQIYGHNVSGQPRLADRLLRILAPMDRLAWRSRLKLKGPKGVRRRIGAHALLGNMAESAKLTDILFLERGSSRHPQFLPADTDEIARRMAAIVLAEIEPYSSLHRECRAAGIAIFPPPEEVERRVGAVLAKAFEGIPAFYLRTGDKLDPDRLTRTIADHARRPVSKV